MTGILISPLPYGRIDMGSILKFIAFFLPERFKPKAGLIGGLLLGAVTIGTIIFLLWRVENLSAQRDKYKNDLLTSENNLKASQAARIAETDALEKSRKDDNDRNQFKQDASIAIEKNRINGDGPLAPVSIDIIDRVRTRYESRAGHNQNPR